MQQAERKQISVKRIVLLIMTALMIAFIFVQSVLPMDISSEESGWLTEHILNPVLNLLGLGSLSNQVVRKIAHITEFTVLAALLLFCFRDRIVKSAGTGFLVAFLDESIQLLSDRGALISDVWIDLIGVAIGTLLGFLLWILLYGKRKKTRTEE